MLLTGLIMAIAQAVKPVMPAKWTPLVVIALGVAGAFVFPPQQEVVTEVVEGLISGLVAIGVYSGVKNTAKPS